MTLNKKSLAALLQSKSARWIAAALAGLVVTVSVSSFHAFAQECDSIRESVLRLHILANSDSEADQSLKLAVRDRILEMDETLFQQAGSLSDAEAAARESLEEIRQTALKEIRRQGYSYDVTAELTNMYFNTRDYETFTMPAGWYDAVRITIGSGKGHNWWCVLYPPLCLPAAEPATQPATQEEELSTVLDEQEAEIVKGRQKYQYSFKLLELLEEVKNFIGGK